MSLKHPGSPTPSALRAVRCNCAAICFLEEDAARQRVNVDAVTTHNSFDHTLWHRLDDERLELKDAWLDSLGVSGTMLVRCRRERA